METNFRKNFLALVKGEITLDEMKEVDVTLDLPKVIKDEIKKELEEKANEIDYYNFICKGLLEKKLQKKSVNYVKVTLKVYKKLKHQFGLSDNCEIKKIYGVPLIIDGDR